MGRKQQPAARRGRVGQVSFYPIMAAGGSTTASRVRLCAGALPTIVRRPCNWRRRSTPSWRPPHVPCSRSHRCAYLSCGNTVLALYEHVLRSSLATVVRYRTATQHLENYATSVGRICPAHQLDAEGFEN